MFIFLFLFQSTQVKISQPKMGSVFEITAVHHSEELAKAAIFKAYAEIDRLENLISSWKPDSETSQIHRAAGQNPVKVGPELFGLIQRSQKVSKLTGGAFDITVGPVLKLWHFKGEPAKVPVEDELSSALKLVGFEKIQLDVQKQTVFLPQAGMRIGFGAIGKGFAAMRAMAILKEHGVKGGIVNAGGDLMVFGTPSDGQAWPIKLAHPRQKETILAELQLTDQAIVTSGDYEQYFVLDDKRYTHIIHPKTGWPVEELVSVTVICPDAEVADALATAITVMGTEKGLELVNRLKGFMAILVDQHGQIHLSETLKTQFPEVMP